MSRQEEQERRLARLEENSCFQDRKLEELEKSSEELRLQLLTLEKTFQRFYKELRRLEDELFHPHAGEEPLPPHWQEKQEQANILKKGENA